uniref:DUF4178 domain-containing protein n=1 Tax=Candidatus Kentrum sp. MB TaxID=2138164 RepID=A0A451BCE2_9GAMM|nr:MAG: hypothetical protein BECKMB1821G_GA0114241_103530 [Candidatus Kentron sp. MB]VFK32521.1 MAG: hypothetical protein BECKMB1821I_GA0114274_103410 [Candidatus Kentron sp. MB]VFK75957.1 MAG: hypothetical protein BECKMB1821H_GA0114242_103710 [Candidatus Kentron sp. MB]
MSILKNLFRGVRKETEDTSRVLQHPRDLRIGDIVKFGFAAQQDISNKTFRVEGIDTCDLGGEPHKKTLFTLNGAGARIRLAVADTGQGERLEVGRAVLPEDVEQIFDMDAFLDLLDPETGVHHVLERIGEPVHLAGWVGPVYRQEAGHNAYYHAGDYRARPLPDTEDEGDAFSYYLLVSDDRKCGVEVQVYDGGRTEVYLLVYLTTTKIEELWPAADAS